MVSLAALRSRGAEKWTLLDYKEFLQSKVIF